MTKVTDSLESKADDEMNKSKENTNAENELNDEDVIMSIQHFNDGEEVSKKTTKITISVDASNSNDYNEVTEMPNSDEYYDEYYDAHGQDYIDNTLMGGNPKTYKNKIPQKKI